MHAFATAGLWRFSCHKHSTRVDFDPTYCAIPRVQLHKLKKEKKCFKWKAVHKQGTAWSYDTDVSVSTTKKWCAKLGDSKHCGCFSRELKTFQKIQELLRNSGVCRTNPGTAETPFRGGLPLGGDTLPIDSDNVKLFVSPKEPGRAFSPF